MGSWQLSLPLDGGLTFVDEAARSPWWLLATGLGTGLLVALGCLVAVAGVHSAAALQMMVHRWLPASQAVLRPPRPPR
ncbi:MAG: hypothetical protein K1X89_10965 [Myxococcaceae bacterium]|nr:hypothetical protein [Myxococcaceae bacterium]